MNYKFFKLPDGTQAEAVEKTTDDKLVSTVPFDVGNADYQEYLEWVAKGNTAEAAD